jgi:hypothetical protein
MTGTQSLQFVEGLPVPIERRRKPSVGMKSKRGFLRASGGHEGRSERPARWHGQSWRVTTVRILLGCATWLVAFANAAFAQAPPYDVRPDVAPPYWRIRYEAAKEPGGLIFPVTYTAWIPPGVKPLRGVIVHQHGCGEGSCTSGLSGAWDLHWQALASRHDCALVAPAYEQPEGADCQMWCDPRNGSAAAFKRALADLGAASGHPELATVPWALWGHSGGGHWAGGLTMLEPERVVAAWLRSGVPLFEANPDRAGIKPHVLPDAALAVPIMCNPGTKEGVTATDNKFKGVWPANQAFFKAVRSRGGLVGVAIDPLTTHECGNSRYLAIPWLDACLAARLPAKPAEPLAAMPADEAWLAPIAGGEPVAARGFGGDPLTLGWLPSGRLAAAWMQYVKDTAVADTTPPPAPTALRLAGTALTWEAEADLDSGLAGFVIERNGERIATLPEKQRNPFGRPVFQGLLYSDTPPQPLAVMRHPLSAEQAAEPAAYRVLALNTVGLETPSARPEQAADGTVTLHGREATVLGTTLRYETAEAKQTLGFWTKAADAAAWTFTVTEPGEFDVEVLQGCGKGQGGSPMSVVFNRGAAESKLAFTVEDTGGFQQFRPRVIGRVTLAAGDHLLRIQPERIAKAAACDIRQVRLIPAAP